MMKYARIWSHEPIRTPLWPVAVVAAIIAANLILFYMAFSLD